MRVDISRGVRASGGGTGRAAVHVGDSWRADAAARRTRTRGARRISAGDRRRTMDTTPNDCACSRRSMRFLIVESATGEEDAWCRFEERRRLRRRERDDDAARPTRTVDLFRDEWCGTVQYCIIEIVIITHRTVIHARIVRDETLDSDSRPRCPTCSAPHNSTPSSSIEVARDVDARRRARVVVVNARPAARSLARARSRRLRLGVRSFSAKIIGR